MRKIKRFLRFLVFCLLAAVFWSGYVVHQISEVKKIATPRKADVAIVLGAAVWENVPSPGLRERLDEAVLLYNQHYVPYILVSGGQDPGDQVDEATAMQNYLVEKGVPVEYILLENKATSTYENLLYSKEIMQQHSLRSALVVSHYFHLARALDMAKSLGITAYPVGTDSTVMMVPYYTAREVLAYTKWKLSAYLPISP